MKDVIKSGGEWVSSLQIEELIEQFPGVKEAAVIGIADAQWGEVGMAIVAIKLGQSLSEADIHAHCAGNLARFKCPRLIRFVDALPRNATGKIHKPTLRKNFASASPTDLVKAKAS